MKKVNNSTQIHFPKTQQDKFKNVPKPYMQVAEGMERQFTNHLLGEMRKTIDKTEARSNAERIYESMLDDERAKLMANSENGLGVKEVVLNQIYPQYKNQHNPQGLRTYQQQNSLISQKGEPNE